MNQVIRGNLKEHAVRFFIADTKNLTEKMRQIHGTTPTATAAAGRMLAAVSMMGCALKNEQESVTAVIDGDGEMGRIIAVGDYSGNVRCDIYNPEISVYINEKGKLDVQRAIGKGTLTVIQDSGIKQPYTGQIELISSEIAEDFTYYFAVSEQIPSVVALGVYVEPNGSVSAAGGFIIQVMPDCDAGFITLLEQRVSALKPISELLREQSQPEGLLPILFPQEPYAINKKQWVDYKCFCSQERVYKMLQSLGDDELEAMIKEDHGAQIQCHFCKKTYEITESKLSEIIRHKNRKG